MANKIYVANEQTLQTVKTDVNGLHTKMGQTSDASTSSTVFGKLNGIGAKVSELLAPITQKVNSIYTKIGEPSTTQTTSVMGKLNQVLRNQTASAGVTAQTKQFTEVATHTSGSVSIQGKGRAFFVCYTYSRNIRVENLKIDGVYVGIPEMSPSAIFEVYFEQSLSCTLTDARAIVQT